MNKDILITEMVEYYEVHDREYFPYSRQKMKDDAESFLNLLQIAGIPLTNLRKLEPSIAQRNSTTVYVQFDDTNKIEIVKNLLSISGFYFIEGYRDFWFKL